MVVATTCDDLVPLTASFIPKKMLPMTCRRHRRRWFLLQHQSLSTNTAKFVERRTKPSSTPNVFFGIEPPSCYTSVEKNSFLFFSQPPRLCCDAFCGRKDVARCQTSLVTFTHSAKLKLYCICNLSVFANEESNFIFHFFHNDRSLF